MHVEAIDGHRAMPCRASIVLRRAIVPPGRAMDVPRAWPTAQGTAHGPFFRAVPPGEHGRFHRAVPALDPLRYQWTDNKTKSLRV